MPSFLGTQLLRVGNAGSRHQPETQRTPSPQISQVSLCSPPPPPPPAPDLCPSRFASSRTSSERRHAALAFSVWFLTLSPARSRSATACLRSSARWRGCVTPSAKRRRMAIPVVSSLGDEAARRFPSSWVDAQRGRRRAPVCRRGRRSSPRLLHFPAPGQNLP